MSDDEKTVPIWRNLERVIEDAKKLAEPKQSTPGFSMLEYFSLLATVEERALRLAIEFMPGRIPLAVVECAKIFSIHIRERIGLPENKKVEP